MKSTHEKKKKSDYKMRYLGGNINAKISWARLRTIATSITLKAVNESSCINSLGSNQGKKKLAYVHLFSKQGKLKNKFRLND